MSIRRAPRPDSNFYVLDKSISEDKALSWAARGMLVFLLGKPDNWVVSVAALVNETVMSDRPSGRDAVYATIAELKAAGYVRAEVARADAGTFGGTEYFVHERPQPLTEKPEAVEPHTDKPDTAQPDTANPTLTRTDKKQELKKNQGLNKSSRGSYTPEFEEAWGFYPTRPGNSKADAYAKWSARLKEGATTEEMLAGVKRYADYCVAQRTEPQYIKQASTFFGPGRHYLSDWTAVASPIRQPTRVSPKQAMRDDWRAQMDRLREQHNGEAHAKRDDSRDDSTIDVEARVVGP